MAEKKVKTRIQSKHDTAANWANATNFVPLAGEIIIYDADSTTTYPRVKIGDGTTVVGNLPFQVTKETATISADGLMSATDKAKLNYTNIAYGTCATAAATAAKTITLSGNAQWTLTTGSVIMVYFSTSNSASNVTLNVNGTGAYPIWYNNAEYTSNGTAYTGYAKRVIVYMFNGTHWVWVTSSYDANSTYTNAGLGQGYGTCSTAAATAAKAVTLSSYVLTTGGIVTVKFTYAVPANATMNINSKGAKNIYYKGAKITAGVINAGDYATFRYDGTQYHLISIDRWGSDIGDISTALTTILGA